VASLQVVEALKILIGDESAGRELVTVDVWPLRVRAISLADARRAECPCCGERKFEFLDARAGGAATSLCGRNTVQVRPVTNGTTIDLDALAGRLGAAGEVERTPFFVRCVLREGGEGGMTLTVFPDGRTMVHGTSDPAVARSVHARYVGH
jgi:adenylyltransferase/sulfurtransferase